MKKKILNSLVIALFISGSAFAQLSLTGGSDAAASSAKREAPPADPQITAVPTTMNYQAVARDVSGNILPNQTVGLRLTVEDGPGGSALYSERQTPTTNQFGLLTIKLGAGTVLSGTWAGINWSNGNQWLKVDMDPTGGNSYTTMGESEMLSVPFANYAVATAAVSGTTNYLSKFTGSGTLGDARIMDDNTRIQFGGATGSQAFNYEAPNYCDITIHNAGTGEALFFANRFDSASYGGMVIGNASVLKWGVQSYNSNNLSIYNWVSTEDAMTILSSNSYVGIGTSTPQNRLQVVDDGQYGIGVYGENTYLGTYDGIGVYGKSVNAPYYGIGTYGEGGWMGVQGYGNSDGGTGTTYGVYANANGTGGPRIGIYATASDGTANYAGWFDGRQHIAYDQPILAVPQDGMLSLNGAPTTNTLPLITLFDSDEIATNGLSVIGVSYATGMNVGDGNGASWAPVNASAFNVSSDRRMKRDIIDITKSDYDKYLSQIRNIETATYFYNWEKAETRPYAHIGVIAQSLPEAVQSRLTESPSKVGSPERLGVNLADLAGLTLVGVQALDSKYAQLEQQIADLKAEIQLLKNK
jgi:hypothetical protein